MSGRWVAYLPEHHDCPRVWQSKHDTTYGQRTRKKAIIVLRRDLERQHKAAQEKVAELGRALANLLELEEKQ